MMAIGARGQQRCFQREGMKVLRQRLHAQPEHAGNFLELQTEEIFDLRAGDQDGDAVGEADDDRARNELHRRAQAGQRP